MICRIADLIADVPESGGLSTRCGDYLCCQTLTPDIRIREEAYRRDRYDPRESENSIAYMESAYQFYVELVRFGGLYLHSSAVVLDGRAYLFSGHCGAGKSTHTRLWQKCFRDARIINDDKPALRCIDGVWYAYGTPWCGKDGINCNLRAPLAGICFVKKAGQNSIRRLAPREALTRVMAQTIRRFPNAPMLDAMLSLLEDLLGKIPVYELENRPEEAAAKLSHDTMYHGAMEIGL